MWPRRERLYLEHMSSEVEGSPARWWLASTQHAPDEPGVSLNLQRELTAEEQRLLPPALELLGRLTVASRFNDLFEALRPADGLLADPAATHSREASAAVTEVLRRSRAFAEQLADARDWDQAPPSVGAAITSRASVTGWVSIAASLRRLPPGEFAAVQIVNVRVGAGRVRQVFGLTEEACSYLGLPPATPEAGPRLAQPILSRLLAVADRMHAELLAEFADETKQAATRVKRLASEVLAGTPQLLSNFNVEDIGQGPFSPTIHQLLVEHISPLVLATQASVKRRESEADERPGSSRGSAEPQGADHGEHELGENSAPSEHPGAGPSEAKEGTSTRQGEDKFDFVAPIDPLALHQHAMRFSGALSGRWSQALSMALHDDDIAAERGRWQSYLAAVSAQLDLDRPGRVLARFPLLVDDLPYEREMSVDQVRIGELYAVVEMVEALRELENPEIELNPAEGSVTEIWRSGGLAKIRYKAEVLYEAAIEHGAVTGGSGGVPNHGEGGLFLRSVNLLQRSFDAGALKGALIYVVESAGLLETYVSTQRRVPDWYPRVRNDVQRLKEIAARCTMRIENLVNSVPVSESLPVVATATRLLSQIAHDVMLDGGLDDVD